MSYEKRAVHFGGGNIGRGFVAEFLHNSGYFVTFVDVVDDLINSITNTKHYVVTEIGDDGRREFNIDHYQAINSKYHEQAVIDEIAKADTVTCAVGPNILRFIGPVIAKGIEARKLDYPLAVIACENMIGATDKLKEFIVEKFVDDKVKTNLDKYVRFANSAIDRIVPQQPPNSGLNVLIEKFFEWCVHEKPFHGVGAPKIEGVHYVDELEPYIERKLFTVNTSHATAAYYGYNRKIPYIHEAMANKEIHDTVRDCIKETGALIVKKHGITQEDQDKYIEAIVKRISNHELKDAVERVGRAPLRKLGRKERYIGPAAQLAERGLPHDNLVAATEFAFRFQNVKDDEESVELAKILKEHDAKAVVEKVCGLEQSHPLFAKIVPIVEKVQKDTK